MLNGDNGGVSGDNCMVSGDNSVMNGDNLTLNGDNFVQQLKMSGQEHLARQERMLKQTVWPRPDGGAYENAWREKCFWQ